MASQDFRFTLKIEGTLIIPNINLKEFPKKDKLNKIDLLYQEVKYINLINNNFK